MIDQSAVTLPEPSLSVQFLPRCTACHAPHPLAGKPPVDRDDCPSCGAVLPQPGAPFDVPAVLVGFHPATLLARLFLGLAKLLLSIAKRI